MGQARPEPLNFLGASLDFSDSSHDPLGEWSGIPRIRAPGLLTGFEEFLFTEHWTRSGGSWCLTAEHEASAEQGLR